MIEYDLAPELGLFGMLAAYFHARLPFLHKHCLICDRQHLFAGAMLKPSVCSRALCTFSLQVRWVGCV